MIEDGEKANIPQLVVNLYSMFFKSDLHSYANGALKLTLPRFSAEDLISLCQRAEELFKQEPVLLRLPDGITIIGDLHGHLLDLLRILQTYGLPENKSFLFLGDIVDRGEFSTETVTLVYSLKILYPKNVYIIRGNHEFAFLNTRCGFSNELNQIYGDSKVFHAFLASFAFIPITALIDSKFICVHGGLGPSWFSINQASNIERPIDEFGDDLTDSMLWSDPNQYVSDFEPSNRGTGFFFGDSSLSEFLDLNNLKTMIRAHECVTGGCEFMFGGKLATVFSASNYCGLIPNNSACLTITEGRLEPKKFPPFQYLKRENVNFKLNSIPRTQGIGISKSINSIQPLPSPHLPPLSIRNKPNTNQHHRPVIPNTSRSPSVRWNNKMKTVNTPR